MIQLLLMIVSYGAALLLLMPATAAGIICAAAAGVAGIVILICKKIPCFDFKKGKIFPLLFFALLIAACLGVLFYDRWNAFPKMKTVAALLHVSKKKLVFCAAVTVSLLSVYFLCFLQHIITEKLRNFNENLHFAISLISCIIASVVTVNLSQFMIKTKTLSMGFTKYLMGIMLVLGVILFLYALFGKTGPSILLGSGLFMVISTINVYVYKFRVRLFEPVDIFSAGTAMNVADNYNLLPIPANTLKSWIFFALMVLFFRLISSTRKTGIRKRPALLAACVVSLVSVFVYTSSLQTYHWGKEGAQFNGYLLDFAGKLKEISMRKPGDYSTAEIAAMADKYGQQEGETQANHPQKQPHIIVIMDEAFSDLRVLGDFTTNKEVMPFISSLKENTVSGYTLTSVYGGNTANSEYEFLTGNTMAWLSPNAVPFQQYVRSPAWSMVSYLKTTYDYRCIAMHPYYGSGWNRPAAYGHFGFDESHFIEDFPRKNMLRKYVSDREMFDFLIETFEKQKDNPLFLFGVTMQNHGDYTYTGERYTPHIYLDQFRGEYPEMEQYLSLIYETDRAVEYLISYFRNVEEDVVILFFGDHQPKTPEAFYNNVCGIDMDNLDEKQKTYMVPFFIWANYDIEEKYVDCTSLNYLSGYVYEAAGIPLPPYNLFLRELEETIPAINANGFYSPAAGGYLPFDRANEEEQAGLNRYKMLQYNNIFDKKHRNDILFPTPK